MTNNDQYNITQYDKCDTEAQNPSLVVFDFFVESYSTLHLLQIYRIKISRF